MWYVLHLTGYLISEQLYPKWKMSTYGQWLGYRTAHISTLRFPLSVSVSLCLCLSPPLPFLSPLSLPPYLSSLPLPLHGQNFTVCWETSYML